MKYARVISILAGVLVIAAFASACASYRVRTDYDPAADFSGFERYRWMEIEPADDPRVDNDLLRNRIQRAIDDELAAKGLSSTEADDAQLLVVYHIAIERKIDIGTTTSRYGYRRYPYAYRETYVREYDVGALIIDLVRADTRELVWRGSGQSQLNERATPEQRDQRVRAVVAAIFEKFPPGR